ncbi:hypothetical protein SADUNF_Sadunf19G0029600 [Salix dunnii]|uniref:Uncharacterized protein n=1 Tax=Salix dunnii TaxID=1413687 RepID=A0A835MCC6_9ROSI|nr:hypothetical protein SADUNF_Sadunf19G0029600 [Salix dunnii]
MSAISSLLRFLLIHVLLLSSHSNYICKAFEWEAPSRSSDAISVNDFPSYRLRVLRRRIPLPPSPTVNTPPHYSPPPLPPPPPRAPPPPPPRRCSKSPPP